MTPLPNPDPGTIIWATVADRNGHVKDRPLVVLSLPPNPTLPILCCACTTRDQTPRPATYMRLPWDAEGRSGTGLKEPCFAVASWLVEISEESIRRISGRITPLALSKLLQKVNALP
jgi:hypothetical protein